MKEQHEGLISLEKKINRTVELLGISKRRQEMEKLSAQMESADFWSNQEKAAATAQKFETLKNEVDGWEKLARDTAELIRLADDLEKNPDAEMEADIVAHIVELEKEFNAREFLVFFSGSYDAGNAIVSFHAGSGGTEAQDWTEMLMRMITRFAERHHWQVTLLDESRGTETGVKSATIRIAGRYSYGYLQSEHGTHRLVRISPFDAEKMRHTSFALIEVIPEIPAENIAIDAKDLRIDTFMSGGKGGQSVNTTYSAVRIVHIPTGISVQCQNERSQLQNKETALKILAGKLQKIQEEKETAEREHLRGELKSPEWGSQIRSYVLHPYHMVKDVRTKYETADTDAVLNGEFDSFVESYVRWKAGRQTDNI